MDKKIILSIKEEDFIITVEGENVKFLRLQNDTLRTGEIFNLLDHNMGDKYEIASIEGVDYGKRTKMANELYNFLNDLKEELNKLSSDDENTTEEIENMFRE